MVVGGLGPVDVVVRVGQVGEVEGEGDGEGEGHDDGEMPIFLF